MSLIPSWLQALRRNRVLRELTTGVVLAVLLIGAHAESLPWPYAPTPTWWTTRGVLSPGVVPDDFAAINQGQLKNIVSASIAEMNAKLTGGAGPALNAMVNSWATPSSHTDDFAVVNQGQVKAVALPIYQRLVEVGVFTALPAWTNSSSSGTDDYALANIGQVKNLFAFNLPEAPTLTLKSWFNQQLVLANQLSPFGLLVTVTNGDVTVPNENVTFEVFQSQGGLLETTNLTANPLASLSVVSDSSGFAKCQFRAPSQPSYCWIRASLSNEQSQWFLMTVAGVTGPFPNNPPGTTGVDFLRDSDADGISDAEENVNGSDPKDATQSPHPENFVKFKSWTAYKSDIINVLRVVKSEGPDEWNCSRKTHNNTTVVRDEKSVEATRPNLDLDPYTQPASADWKLDPGFQRSFPSSHVFSNNHNSETNDATSKILIYSSHKLQIISDTLLTKDYSLRFAVYRQRREGSVVKPEVYVETVQLTLPANSLEGQTVSLSYEPKLNCNDTYVFKPVEPISVDRVSFESSLSNAQHHLRSDDGNTIYKAPHWWDKNHDGLAETDETTGERNYPLAFKRGSPLSVKVKFHTRGILNYSYYQVKAVVTGGLTLPEVETGASFDTDGWLTLQSTPFEQKLNNTIQFYNGQGNSAFTIQWQVREGDSGSWLDAGTTKHTFYITGGDRPSGDDYNYLPETFLNVACRNAHGLGDNPQQVVDAVFSEFMDRKVCRVIPSTGNPQADPMVYAHDEDTLGFDSIVNFIALGKGRCGHWANLFSDCLRLHGINESEQVVIEPEDPNTVNSIPFSKTNWRFKDAYESKEGFSLSLSYPFSEALLFINNWDISDVWNPIPKTAVPAQGTDNPSMYFADHVVNKFNGKIYDSSYGVKFDNLVDWEDSALAARGAWAIPSGINRPDLFWIEIANQPNSRETYSRENSD
ncbi:transglutaminase domain-containing protein [Prosthecobacter dejongeii]|uniref:Transglutaminase-like superfamily protein n=1 Tax=Prosthecobacter dejongeii TaxID=48465 RepID=A0A7W7YK34_9BACT|nr:transglutaminase domain-containing protein [Prosthecobacter dejongeii]MBB5037467.1 hypothetical protein [Prosthecobacter dejongeii]